MKDDTRIDHLRRQALQQSVRIAGAAIAIAAIGASESALAKASKTEVMYRTIRDGKQCRLQVVHRGQRTGRTRMRPGGRSDQSRRLVHDVRTKRMIAAHPNASAWVEHVNRLIFASLTCTIVVPVPCSPWKFAATYEGNADI